ncbi:Tetraspanin-2 [Zea mays]|jgi:hypothetical protein|uniref:Tetraspanin-2 n=1 Tax=Zea mays TaxID=4577 RepID=A0A1D6QCW9_MAIZE|nr:Tetraspanin-2 [Zea mays]
MENGLMITSKFSPLWATTIEQPRYQQRRITNFEFTSINNRYALLLSGHFPSSFFSHFYNGTTMKTENVICWNINLMIIFLNTQCL